MNTSKPRAEALPALCADEWRGKRVLVTGGTGFLGAHVVDRLAALGAETHATARDRCPPSRHGVRWSVLDLGDAAAVAAVAADMQCDVVLHLGGRVSAAVDPGLVAPTFRSLLASSVSFLEATEAGQIGRLVLVGSTDEPRGSAAPTSPYSAAKGAVSSYARFFAASFGTPVVVVRPSETFGPGQAAAKLLPYVAASALRGDAPRLSSGRRRGDWVYVDDVVDGMLAAALHAPDGAELDFGTGILHSNRQLVEGLLQALGTDVAPVWGALPDRPAEPEHSADVEHTMRVLGWRSRVSLQEGLRRTADAARRITETADLPRPAVH